MEIKKVGTIEFIMIFLGILIPVLITTSFGETSPLALKYDSVITYINSEGNGKIAIKFLEPSAPRYGDETGILLTVGGFMTPGASSKFNLEIPAAENGLVAVSFLWPGSRDNIEKVQSDGVFDYGGKNCIKALSDVVLFLAGKKKDINGKYVTDILKTKVNTSNLGLHAFSHPGIAVVQFLANYPESAKYVSYFVGGENPTIDKVTAVEVGHYVQNGEKRIPVENPMYSYPQDYSLNDLSVDYSLIRYDDKSGIPYFDLDKNNHLSSKDFQLEKRRPSIFEKYIYSYDLLSALVENGELSESDWPENWATPEQAKMWWKDRSTANQFEKISEYYYSLHIMLVFGRLDHVQTAKDKPHIHQMFEGFHDIAGIGWIKLNPDRSYLEYIYNIVPNSENVSNRPLKYAEHPANSQPSNWMDIIRWSVPNTPHVSWAVVAGIVEMADRTQHNNWSEDISSTLK